MLAVVPASPAVTRNAFHCQLLPDRPILRRAAELLSKSRGGLNLLIWRAWGSCQGFGRCDQCIARIAGVKCGVGAAINLAELVRKVVLQFLGNVRLKLVGLHEVD